MSVISSGPRGRPVAQPRSKALETDAQIRSYGPTGQTLYRGSNLSGRSPRHIIACLLFCTLAFTSAIRADEPRQLQDIAADPAETDQTQSTPPLAKKQNSIPPKVGRYAQHLLKKHDQNHDGILQKDEWHGISGHPELMDTNKDEVIRLDELTSWIAEYGRRIRIGVPHGIEPGTETESAIITVAQTQEEATGVPRVLPTSIPAPGERRRDLKFYVPSHRLPTNLPEWFITRDQDGDGQLTAGEFSPTGTAAELAEFASYDINSDGVVTAKECVGKPAEKATAIKESNDTSAQPANPDVKPSRRKKQRQSP